MPPITITRQILSVENVVVKTLAPTHPELAYIRIRSFTPRETCAKVSTALQHLKEQKATGVILDLRDNEGGLVDQAVCVLGLLVGPQKLAYSQKNLATQSVQLKTTSGPQITDLPLITLINERTVSSAEILSGALQDHRRALILGQRSYGKGTVQTLKPFPGNPAIALYSTEAQFFLPSGQSNQDVGIVPDLVVPSLSPEGGVRQRSPASARGSNLSSLIAEVRACLAPQTGRLDPSGGDYPVNYAGMAMGCLRRVGS